MISQSDIIKTLINMNCTDESVMSMALSPSFTPQKLLEKLTEVERFDLALDVSMKLGLDVLPLWRIWAMRYLKNGNFSGARDKFRHYLPRLKQQGNRGSQSLSRSLSEILDQLRVLKENPLSFQEEIELIKTGKLDDAHIVQRHGGDTRNIHSKQTIYRECMFYLSEYGCVQDRIKFYIGNQLWHEAAESLIEHSRSVTMVKFFQTNVINACSSSGHLSYLVAALMDNDPNIERSCPYFRATYEYYTRHKRYNSLHFIQEAIGDNAAAAETLVKHFFLLKPIRGYRELVERLHHLVGARQNYHDYKSRIEGGPSISNELFKKISRDEVDKRIGLIDLQIQITRNFCLNEVSGFTSTSGMDTVSRKSFRLDGDESPVTLFETDHNRLTHLTAMVLIYFDLSCKAYFSRSGLDTANQLIHTFMLDKMKVYKTAMRIMIEDDSSDLLENSALLLERLKEDYRADPSKFKTSKRQNSRQVVTNSGNINTPATRAAASAGRQFSLGETTRRPNSRAGVLNIKLPSSVQHEVQVICDEVIHDSIVSCRETDYETGLAKLLSDEAKIELFIEQGKLSNAQRLACDTNRPDYVSIIIDEAMKRNQNHVKTVCELWLAKHGTGLRPS